MAMIQHLGIWLPDGERHIQAEMDKCPEIDGKGTYQYRKIELALRHVKQHRVAIDAGAHVGTWSRILAKHFGRVEAFEPNPDNCACFTRNVSAENVTLHRMALGDNNGTLRFSVEPNVSSHTYVDAAGPIVADVRTLDSFGFENVDFIKLDVDGMEKAILRGAHETLERWRPTMIVEQKPGKGYGYTDLGALEFLKKMGAKVVAQKAGDYVLTW